MLKFNAHLGFQFNELPFLQRIEAAAAAGFRAVEFPSPYEFDASLLADHLAQYNLPLIQFAAPAGVTKGIAALQGKEQEFRDGLREAARYAKALNCSDVHIMSGVTTPQDESAPAYVSNLEYAVKYLEDRIENLQGGDAHSTERDHTVRLAVDDDGTIRGLDVEFLNE